MSNVSTIRPLLRLLFVSCVSGWLLGGCSEKIEPKPNTYSQLLTGTEKKAWRLVSFQYIDEGVAGDITQISQTTLPRCRADDQYVFYANAERKFEYSNGATKCSTAEPDVLIEDNWTLVPASASLQFLIPIFFDQALPFTVKNLTQNVLTVEVYYDKTFSAPGNINASQRFTFNAVTTQ